MNHPTQFLSQISLIIAALLASQTVFAISDSWKTYESFVKSVASNSYVQEAWPDHMTQFQETEPENLGVFPKFWPDYCPPVPEPKEHGTNVHNLLPSDIKLVAGIGDSLTAGNGALAHTAFGLLIQYRGRSFSMGGDGNGRGWENGDVVTFPNLLRHFSNDLEGDSIYKGGHDSKYARHNHAIPGSTAHDLKAQAETMIEHLKADPKVDFEKDWKVITIFIGGNDLCDYHMKPGMYEPHQFKQSLQDTLDVLHANVPRAFVNLVETIDVSVLSDLSKGFMCPLLHHFLCRYPAKESHSEAIRAVRDDYLRAVQSLANSGRYDTRDDFVVVDQPFLRNSSYPLKADGTPDFAFFAPDCFHFSERGHATAGTSLWNNMMQPFGKKQTSWSLGQPPECMDPNNPFIKTKVNSPKSQVESADVASPDATSPDATSPDAASPDAASPDAASPDAAPPDASRSWFRTSLVDGGRRLPVEDRHMPGIDLSVVSGNEDDWSSQSFPFPLLGLGVGIVALAVAVVAVVGVIAARHLRRLNKRADKDISDDDQQHPTEVSCASSTADLTNFEVPMGTTE